MWAVLIVGTAAFWAVIFLAVRALYTGRDTSVAPRPLTIPANTRLSADRLQERLDRGEITVEEYVHLYAQTDTVAGRHSSRPPHH